MKATVQPKNSDTKNGVRVYQWGDTGIECISVTSVRMLIGSPHNLVTWKLNQIIDRSILQPNEYVAQASKGEKYLRNWLREGEGAETEDRKTAAERGTAVHAAIEMDLTPEQCTDEVRPYIRQFRAMRADIGFEVMLQERQVWNLSAGYAGTLDAIGVLTNKRRRGDVLVIDWKTSKDVYLDYVMQAHAYLAAEFVGNDGVIDHDATKLLHAAKRGALAKLSPIGWSWHEFDFDPDILRAWFGSLAFARYIYDHPDPSFDTELKGTAR